MATNPVFPLYYNDMDRSTKTWTNAEYGAFMRLLVHQWSEGFLPSDLERLEMIAPGLHKVWGTVGVKFKETEKGKLQNAHLEEIRQDQIEFKKRQSERGKKGGNPAFKKDDTKREDNPDDKREPKRPRKRVSKPSTSISSSTPLSTPTPISLSNSEEDISGEKPDVQEIVEEKVKVETVILEPVVITEPGPGPKPETQVQKAAKIWEAHRELNDMGKFLWEGAETGSLKKLLAKIEAKMITPELTEPTEDDILNGLGHFFNNRRIWGKWLCDQWTLQTINSKFDDIYHNIKKHYGNGKQQSTAAELEQKIRDNAYALAKKRGYKEPGNDPQ